MYLCMYMHMIFHIYLTKKVQVLFMCYKQRFPKTIFYQQPTRLSNRGLWTNRVCTAVPCLHHILKFLNLLYKSQIQISKNDIYVSSERNFRILEPEYRIDSGHRTEHRILRLRTESPNRIGIRPNYSIRYSVRSVIYKHSSLIHNKILQKN
jgi:hypothetical protein